MSTENALSSLQRAELLRSHKGVASGENTGWNQLDLNGHCASDRDKDRDCSEPAELPSLGSGRHFSWAILEQIDEPEVPDRGVPTRRPLALSLPLLDADQEQALGRIIQRGTGPDSDSRTRTPEAAEALEQLVLANMRLCIRPARSAPRGAQQFDDIVQHALMGLFRAAEKFDPELGNRFSTYAMYWIRQAIDRGHARDGRLIRVPTHILTVQKKLNAAMWSGAIDEHSALELAAAATGIEAPLIEAARAAELTVHAFEELADDLAARGAQDPRCAEAEADGCDQRLHDWTDLVEAESSEVAGEALMALIADVLRTLPLREQEVLIHYYGLEGDEELTLEELGDWFGLTRERIRQIRNDALHSLRIGIATARGRHAGFDEDFGFEPRWLTRLADSGATESPDRARSHRSARKSTRPSRPQGNAVGKERPVAKAVEAPDPVTARRKLVRSAISELAQATSSLTWWPSPPLPSPTRSEHAAIKVTRGLLREPFAQSGLIDALAALGESVDAEVIARAHSRIVLEALEETVRDGWPGFEELARLLRIARFLGVSEDLLTLEMAIRAAPATQMTLERGLHVMSTWRYDADDPDHQRLRTQMHEHGAHLGLVWKNRSDDQVNLVIAERLDHRSTKTLYAHLNGLGVCDIPSFLKAGPGSTINVARTPEEPPKFYTCRRCTRVLMMPVGGGTRRPSRCDECSDTSNAEALSVR